MESRFKEQPGANDQAVLVIVYADSSIALRQVKLLFEEYADSLGIDLGFQNFDRELATLPGDYALPGGCLLLGLHDEQPAGCVALRKIDSKTCEMKRLYVKPKYRGLGFGKSLVKEIIHEAKDKVYRSMRLDTLPSMLQARAMYKSLGFKEIKPYRYSPVPGTSFMELDLNEQPQMPGHNSP